MKDRPLYIVGFMIVLAAVFGSGVTGLYLVSRPTLERNQAFLRERALVEVFGLGDPAHLGKAEVLRLSRERIDRSETLRDPETGWESPLLKAYADAEHRQLLAYGIVFRGLGFWAPIEGILAVTPDLQETLGLTIVRQSETPGLGGRIAEPVFTAQFRRGIRISPPEKGPVITLKGSAADNPRHVDAITGATQTSMAMEKILARTLAKFHRAMRARAAGGNPQ